MMPEPMTAAEIAKLSASGLVKLPAPVASDRKEPPTGKKLTAQQRADLVPSFERIPPAGSPGRALAFAKEAVGIKMQINKYREAFNHWAQSEAFKRRAAGGGR
jgi:hypothetical protein